MSRGNPGGIINCSLHWADPPMSTKASSSYPPALHNDTLAWNLVFLKCQQRIWPNNPYYILPKRLRIAWGVVPWNSPSAIEEGLTHGSCKHDVGNTLTTLESWSFELGCESRTLFPKTNSSHLHSCAKGTISDVMLKEEHHDQHVLQVNSYNWLSIE